MVRGGLTAPARPVISSGFNRLPHARVSQEPRAGGEGRSHPAWPRKEAASSEHVQLEGWGGCPGPLNVPSKPEAQTAPTTPASHPVSQPHLPLKNQPTR